MWLVLSQGASEIWLIADGYRSDSGTFGFGVDGSSSATTPQRAGTYWGSEASSEEARLAAMPTITTANPSAPLLIIENGAPPVNIVGLRLEGHALVVRGGKVRLIDSLIGTRSGQAAGRQLADGGGTPSKPAIEMDGGFVLAERTRFEGYTNGAIRVRDGILTLVSGLLENNHALNGGALHVTGGSAHVANTLFRRNTAAERGGAAFVDGGRLTLTNETLILAQASANTTGTALYVRSGIANYALPAPLGRWIFASEGAPAAFDAGVDGDFPVLCNAGIIGDSYEPQVG